MPTSHIDPNVDSSRFSAPMARVNPRPSTYRIYKIHPGYKSCTVWEGSRMTHARLAEHNTKPLAKDKPGRHAHIAARLFKNFGIPGPMYQADL